jgi:hypothetical protein
MHSTDTEATEHFCTLFDGNFLPMGMALLASLEKHHGNFHLWVICMDDHVESRIRALGLNHVSTIPLAEMETGPLLEAKQNRTRREYCWTLSSFTYEAVFARAPSARRVTYLDADIYFFDDPRVLLKELDESGKHVLYTEHAYAPEYDQSEASGKYCVQFLCFDRSPEAAKVMNWWQERSLEWCYDRIEPGRFGDQKYLEQWEVLFPQETHVVRQVEKTLAPWNVEYYFRKAGRYYPPVFYHFQSLRIIAPRKIRLRVGYKVGPHAEPIYNEYLQSLRGALGRMHTQGLPTPYLPVVIKRKIPVLSWLKNVCILRNERYSSL